MCLGAAPSGTSVVFSGFCDLSIVDKVFSGPAPSKHLLLHLVIHSHVYFEHFFDVHLYICKYCLLCLFLAFAGAHCVWTSPTSGRGHCLLKVFSFHYTLGTLYTSMCIYLLYTALCIYCIYVYIYGRAGPCFSCVQLILLCSSQGVFCFIIL